MKRWETRLPRPMPKRFEKELHFFSFCRSHFAFLAVKENSSIPFLIPHSAQFRALMSIAANNCLFVASWKKSWRLLLGMAARNTPDAKRFVSRAPHKKPEAYLVPTHQSETSRTPRKTPAPLQRSSPMKQTSSPSPPLTRRSTEAPPARRVVVVRSPNNPNVHRGPVDLGDFGQPNAIDRQPVLSNEVTTDAIDESLVWHAYCSTQRSISFDGPSLDPDHLLLTTSNRTLMNTKTRESNGSFPVVWWITCT